MSFSVPLLAYVGAFTSALIVLVGISRFKLLPPEMKILWGFFVFSFLINVLSLVFSYKIKNNLFFYHLNTLLEFCIFVFVFSFWQRTQKLTAVLRSLIFVFLVVWLLSKLFIEDFRQFDNFSSSIKSLVLVAVASHLLYSLFTREWQMPSRDFRFWVIAGVLVYFTADVVFIALGNLIINLPHSDVVRLWSIHWFFGILANILYIIAFLTRQPSTLPRESSLRNL